MADAKTTLEIIIAATDSTGSVFSGVGDKVGDLAGNVKGFTQPFADLATIILGVDAAVNVALLALGTFSIDAAAGFTDGMNEIRTLLDERTTDFGTFSEDVRGFFDSTAQPIDEVLSATYQAISQGIPPDAIADFLASADTLATAGRSTLTEAVDLLAGTANAYGGTINDVAGYADIFFTAVKDGKTTIPELAGAVGLVTSIAAPFGVSVGDVAGAIAALTAYGVPSTTEAATIIKTMIEGLVNPTAAAADAANDLGISLGADVFKNRTLSDTIKDIGEKTGNSAGLVQTMFTSSEALKGILPLMNDPAGKYAKAMSDIEGSAGAADAAYKTMVDNTEKLHGRLTNSIQTILINIGVPLLDEYKGAILGLDGILDGIDIGIKAGSFDPLLDYFSTLFEDIKTFADKIALALPEALEGLDFDALIKSFDGIKDAVIDVFEAIFGEGIDLTTAEGLGTALQGIIDAFATLNNMSAGIISALPDLFAALSSLAQTVASIDPQTAVAIGEVLGLLTVVNIGAGAISAGATAVSLLGTALGGLSTVVPGTISGIITAIGPILGTVAVGGAAGYGIGTLVNDEINKVVEVFTDGKNDTLGGLIYDWTHGGIDQVAAGMTEVETQLDRPAQQIEGKLGPAAKALVDKFKTGATDLAAITWDLDPQGNIAGTVNTLKGQISGLGDAFPTKGLNDVWLNGVQIQWGDAKTAIDKTTSALDGVAKQSKVSEDKMMELASNETIKAMEFSANIEIAGIEANAEIVKAALSSIDTAIDSTGDTWTDLWGQLGDLSGIDKINLKSAIDAEEKRRQGAFEQQKKLIDAEIQLIKDKSELLKKGGSTLNFKFTGADPLSEYIIIELLKKAQVYVTGEGGAMLLGLD